MSLWINVFNVLLIGVAASAIIWALRQQAILNRVRAGLDSLRKGKTGVRLRQDADDTEAVLQAFDALSESLENGAHKTDVPDPTNARRKSELSQISDVLRPSLLALKSYASLLEQVEGDSVEERRNHLARLQTQVDGILRLFESPGDLSEIRQELSGLRRHLATEVSISERPVLIVDGDSTSAGEMAKAVGDAGCKVLVASEAESAGVMAYAVSPSLILMNGAWSGGIAWTILPALLRQPNPQQEATAPMIWFYAVGDDDRCSALTPAAVWLWPLEKSQRLPSESWLSAELSVTGPDPLRSEIVQWLTNQGSTVSDQRRDDLPALFGCCTATPVAETGNGEPQSLPPFALIVPRAILGDGEQLAADFESNTACFCSPEQLQQAFVSTLQTDVQGRA